MVSSSLKKLTPTASYEGLLPWAKGRFPLETRVLHVVAPFDRRDAIGRAVTEIARRLPDVESSLCTSRMLSGNDVFRSVHELGGRDSFFHLVRRGQISDTVRRLRPDIVHLHGGIWTPFLAMSPAFRAPLVLSIYAWPRLPSLRIMFRSSFIEMRSSAVLRGRVVLSTLLPRVAVMAALSSKRIRGVLTQDPVLADELRPLTATLVHVTGGGGEVDHLRADYHAERPIIVFAGRAETARGIDTLLRAMPKVLEAFPLAILKLLFLPTTQLRQVDGLIDSLRIGGHVDVSDVPVDDLREHLAGCTVSVFPFKYDGTTITPPFTAVQAMSVGLPVIGTPVACLSPLLMNGRNGLVVPTCDPGALADAIRNVIADEGKWRALSAGALQTVARSWNWERAASQAAEVYREVLAPT